MVEGARRAVNNNADVIFMCMGSYPRPMLEAMAKDVYDKGVIWVCAAGNQVKVVIAPAVYPGTIAVAAVNPDFRPWSGSCRGPEVDVAAPGEDVYVPTFNGKNETMRFGSGTSYATPHVASAAMLWKAKHLNELNKLYNKPWQIVEAFRYCLQKSVQQFDNRWSQWERQNYGAGLLDINKLLATPLPAANVLKYAYENVNISPSWDLGVTEAVAKIWEALSLKVTGAEASTPQPLSERAQLALGAISGTTVSRMAAEAAVTTLPDSAKEAVLETYFSSFRNPVKYDKK
jgi:subtilisin family serine protease